MELVSSVFHGLQEAPNSVHITELYGLIVKVLTPKLIQLGTALTQFCQLGLCDMPERG